MEKVVARRPTPWYLMGSGLVGVWWVMRMLVDVAGWSWTWALPTAVAAVVLVSWVALGFDAQALVLTDDALEVRRRFRPLTIPRDAILGARGEIPGRPRWSTRAMVETADGTRRLPGFADTHVGHVVEAVQEWAGVDERGPRGPVDDAAESDDLAR